VFAKFTSLEMHAKLRLASTGAMVALAHTIQNVSTESRFQKNTSVDARMDQPRTDSAFKQTLLFGLDAL
jgi:hypothetical protein